MAKELVPNKIIISLDDKGDFDSGLILYKVKIDGVIGRDQKSVSIKNMAFSKLHLANIIDIVIDKVKKEEDAK